MSYLPECGLVIFPGIQISYHSDYAGAASYLASDQANLISPAISSQQVKSHFSARVANIVLLGHLSHAQPITYLHTMHDCVFLLQHLKDCCSLIGQHSEKCCSFLTSDELMRLLQITLWIVSVCMYVCCVLNICQLCFCNDLSLCRHNGVLVLHSVVQWGALQLSALWARCFVSPRPADVTFQYMGTGRLVLTGHC